LLTKGASYPKALVYIETVVEVRVIDQSLPTNCCARLFEINTHDDVKVFSSLVCILLQILGIFKGCIRVIYRTRT
jgi:hypothetical protein